MIVRIGRSVECGMVAHYILAPVLTLPAAMFGRLLPKEGRFFDLFNAHAEQVVRAAHELRR